MSCSEFVSGAFFAVALIGSGVYAPSIIKSQMTFSSNAMITVMMGASATSAIALDVEDRLKLLPKKHSRPSNLGLFEYDGNVVGGALLGVGMSLTGACPGTSLVLAGMGSTNGILVVVGGILGALAFAKLQPGLARIRESLSEANASSDTHVDSSTTTSKTTLDIATAIGIQPITLLLIWVPMCLAAMQLAFAKDQTAREVPWSGTVAPAYGGLLIGAAQLATTLLTGHAIGTSAAYRDVAIWIDRHYLSKSSEEEPKPHLLTPSVIFAGGIVCAAATLSHVLHMSSQTVGRDLSSMLPKTAVLMVAGGSIMVLGARMAGGCTSGHGISGLAKFSLTSLVTTVSMFSAGILTAQMAEC